MNAIPSSSITKAADAHQEIAKTKIKNLDSKATAPIQAADVLNKTPANKSNSSPAAVVSLGSSKAPDSSVYQKNAVQNSASLEPKVAAKIEIKIESKNLAKRSDPKPNPAGSVATNAGKIDAYVTKPSVEAQLRISI